MNPNIKTPERRKTGENEEYQGTSLAKKFKTQKEQPKLKKRNKDKKKAGGKPLKTPNRPKKTQQGKNITGTNQLHKYNEKKERKKNSQD
ncbi:hypothetical protein [Pacificibacter marinus]|uniref:hypothetical protein n=1 Tax=Pacificibacter marinus TaxID=658057 RepID=UPI0008BE2676|nr:hypothetical protein [Pacificibacter marinus]SEK54782.1 hypothetical protein SAMN04488032_103264 [Pacificibacter marinus]